jgi:glycosyltransferase involved in cell wall biosynthesis
MCPLRIKLIVVDNGSTYSSSEILDELGKNLTKSGSPTPGRG